MMSDGPAATPRELSMGICLIVLQGALRESLIMLAESKGDEALSWLSEFEDQLIRDAKGTVTEGISVNHEVALIDDAINILKFVFDGVRRRIAANPPNHE
jgi:hypothetical protein